MPFDGALWLTDDRDGLVWRIDPATNRARPIHLAGRVSGAPAAGRGSIWVTMWDDARLVGIEPETRRVLSRIDAETNRVSASMPIGGSPGGVAVGMGAVWVAGFNADTVWRIEPTHD
jgi:virginiamycin B lyase